MAQLHRRFSGLPHRGVAPRGARFPRLAPACLALACACFSVRAFAQQPPRPASNATGSTDTGVTSGTTGATGDEATRESAAELDAVLGRLRSENAGQRHAAVDQILALDADDLPLIRSRMMAPLPVNPLAIHAAMLRAVHLATGGREGADYDLLDALVELSPRTPDVVVATQRVALARAAGRMQTADAGRVIVAFALEHQKVFRLEATRIIHNSLHDYALPALIEMRHPSDDARLFIHQIREMLHRVTPGESVQTRDNALLAEILRAYGTVRQPETMNVVVSFVNSDRAQVREAARWSVAQYGRDAINALRQAYENYVGEDANPQWGWERTAQELYQANDRRRSEDVARALDDGLAGYHAGNYTVMMDRFEFVLSHHPLYERRGEMVAPLLAYAGVLERQSAARAEEIYRTALRVDPNGASSHRIQSAILYLDAERALALGVADPELYRAAVRVDPENHRAEAQLEAVAQVEVLRARRRRRVVIALGLLVLAAAALGLVMARVRREGEPSGPTRNQRVATS